MGTGYGPIVQTNNSSDDAFKFLWNVDRPGATAINFSLMSEKSEIDLERPIKRPDPTREVRLYAAPTLCFL